MLGLVTAYRRGAATGSHVVCFGLTLRPVLAAAPIRSEEGHTCCRACRHPTSGCGWGWWWHRGPPRGVACRPAEDPGWEPCRRRTTSTRASRARSGRHQSPCSCSPPIVFSLCPWSAAVCSLWRACSRGIGGRTGQLLVVLKVLVAESIGSNQGAGLGVTDVLESRVGMSEDRPSGRREGGGILHTFIWWK